MEQEQLKELVLHQLDTMKALNISVLDVRKKSNITDLMIIATGTSTRHVKAIADAVAMHAKEAGEMPLGIEGERDSEWVLVDLNEIIVHVMIPSSRDFYNLEKLWGNGDPEDAQPSLQQRLGGAA